MKSKSDSTVRDIRRRTRKKYSAEEKIRIVLDGLRGEDSIAVICRREGIHANICTTNAQRSSLRLVRSAYKAILSGKPTVSSEVTGIKPENSQLKELVTELSLKNRVLKKSLNGLDAKLDD